MNPILLLGIAAGGFYLYSERKKRLAKKPASESSTNGSTNGILPDRANTTGFTFNADCSVMKVTNEGQLISTIASFTPDVEEPDLAARLFFARYMPKACQPTAPANLTVNQADQWSLTSIAGPYTYPNPDPIGGLAASRLAPTSASLAQQCMYLVVLAGMGGKLKQEGHEPDAKSQEALLSLVFGISQRMKEMGIETEADQEAYIRTVFGGWAPPKASGLAAGQSPYLYRLAGL